MILGLLSLALFLALLVVLFRHHFSQHHYLGLAFVAAIFLHAGNELKFFIQLSPTFEQFMGALFDPNDLPTTTGTLSLIIFLFVLIASFLKSISHRIWTIFHRFTWVGFVLVVFHIITAEVRQQRTENIALIALVYVSIFGAIVISTALLWKLYRRHHLLWAGFCLLSMGGLAAPSLADSITQTELEKHSTPDSCWLLIENKVYDITTYVQKHPTPSSVLLNLCGKDGTEGWKTKGRKNKPHSKKAELLLKKYYLGELSNSVNAL